jgi:hypothetical protein
MTVRLLLTRPVKPEKAGFLPLPTSPARRPPPQSRLNAKRWPKDWPVIAKTPGIWNNNCARVARQTPPWLWLRRRDQQHPLPLRR